MKVFCVATVLLIALIWVVTPIVHGFGDWPAIHKPAWGCYPQPGHCDIDEDWYQTHPVRK
jgi:hypothetical protein